jgi:tRNA (cmo5U34)-methyltransferase
VELDAPAAIGGGPDLDRMREVLVGATHGIGVRSILDLGPGTGETSLRVLLTHPNAEVVVGRLEEALPGGPFDLAVSSFAVQRLDAPGRARLFAHVAEALRPGGRLVLADVVMPETARSLPPMPLEPDVDGPAPLQELLAGLREAGLAPAVRWRRAGLVVLTADRPGEVALPSVGAAGEAPAPR